MIVALATLSSAVDPVGGDVGGQITDGGVELWCCILAPFQKEEGSWETPWRPSRVTDLLCRRQWVPTLLNPKAALRFGSMGTHP